MSIKQKQCLLCYLGYYDGLIDGIWGDKSITATKAFQREYGLQEDGVFGDTTCEKIRAVIAGEDTDWWEEIEFFRPAEFACKCGCYCDGYPAQMSQTLVKMADRIRRHFGAAATVSSGLRCRTHNANVGGVTNSRHLSGKAMDFCIAGKTAQQVLDIVRSQPEIRYAYAIDDRFVHMDVA